MDHINASAAGQFSIGDDITVNRLGFGSMRITGPGTWGEPTDRVGALETLRKLPDLGINFVDTADSYGPEVSERLICEALFPYRGILVATKGGLTRQGPDRWAPVGRPEYLRQAVLMSLRRLKLERIDLWQLHRIDPAIPRKEQFDVMAQMQREGLIRHLGLSEVTVDDIIAARRVFKVATVQNRFNLIDRNSEDVVDYCATHGIGFIPWFPLAAGGLARSGSAMDEIAERSGATIGQLALAWILRRSPTMLPIPGTSKASHLEANVAAASVQLSHADFELLDRLGRSNG